MLRPAAIKSELMTNRLPIIPVTAALSAALLLSACGKQEAVGDVPSGEELARQADEASAAIRDEAASLEQSGENAETQQQEITLTSYTNALRGYTVMVPEAWTIDEETSDDNGQTVIGPDDNGEFTVNWTENRDNADMTAAIEAVEEAGDAMTGNQVSEDEFRSSGTQDGKKIMTRVLRKPDGSMVQVKIAYPVESAEQMDAIVGQIVDSLALR
jgi:hypothetical protein